MFISLVLQQYKHGKIICFAWNQHDKLSMKGKMTSNYSLREQNDIDVITCDNNAKTMQPDI